MKIGYTPSRTEHNFPRASMINHKVAVYRLYRRSLGPHICDTRIQAQKITFCFWNKNRLKTPASNALRKYKALIEKNRACYKKG